MGKTENKEYLFVVVWDYTRKDATIICRNFVATEEIFLKWRHRMTLHALTLQIAGYYSYTFFGAVDGLSLLMWKASRIGIVIDGKKADMGAKDFICSR